MRFFLRGPDAKASHLVACAGFFQAIGPAAEKWLCAVQGAVELDLSH
jgi:hypothetical protein